jgi:hypothetical protein
MNETTAVQIAGLQELPTKQLLARYAEVFGDEARTWNRTWLLRRLAWRLQALAEGGLSERARRRAEELANDADLRMNPPPAAGLAVTTPELTAVRPAPTIDHRLPPAGTVLTRQYKGVTVQVQVLEQGFAYQGRVYKSLSAVARAVTGSHCNGFHFFKLNPEGDDEPQR